MRTNYVLIDYENVQPESLAPLAHDHFKLRVFVGAKQPKLPTAFAASVQKLGSRAEYIVISGTAPNALDFHIAYYLGKLAAAEASAYFHIISKDTGLDPLVQHLKSNGVSAGRVTSVAEIPLVKVSTAKLPAERLAIVVSWLGQRKAAKPRTVKTLSNSIAALFGKQLAADEVASLVDALAAEGHLSIAGTKVTYPTHAAG